jgi:hypothetical protein
MKQSIWLWWVALAVLLGVLAGAGWYLTRTPSAPPPAPPAAAPPAVVERPVEPAPAPAPMVPSAAVEIPLPPLDQSDDEMRGALVEAVGPGPVLQYLVPDTIVRRLVATLDNLPRQKISLQIRAITPVPGEFIASGEEGARVLAPENFARYGALVRALGATDTATLIRLYRRMYPLMQQAYDELGNPPQHLDARIVEVIDNLLATPDVTGPIALTQPSVFFQFADPELEALSAGQKILLRMGPDNAAIVKAKLRELRAALR